MRLLYERLIHRLTAATPRKDVLRWAVMTALYGCCLLINEHFEWVAALGFTLPQQALIRIAGVMLYIFLTSYSFQKTNHDATIPPFQIPDNLVPDITGDHHPDDGADTVYAPRNHQTQPQPGTHTTKPATNPVN